MPEPTRRLTIVLALLPFLLSMAAFSSGLRAWFQQDDFAHLHLASQTSLTELPAMLVRPIAQGTFRPLSERLFYWAFFHGFGLESQPYRIFCFLFHAANCWLLVLLLQRLTGSTWAALTGAMVWAVNPCLTLPLTWVAATNQVLWTSSVLGTLYLFVRYCQDEQRTSLRWAWAVFLLGFGVLESQVAVPAVLVLFAWLFHKPQLKTALTFFAPAILFAALHMLLIPKAGGKAYAMQFGAPLLHGIWEYWQLSWTLQSTHAWIAYTALGTLAMLCLPGPRKLALLGLGSWLLLLGPVLPLAGHVTDYYLTAPLLGLAILAATAFRSAPRITASVALLWICAALPVSRSYAKSSVARSRNMEAAVRGVAEAGATHPGKTILLAGVNDGLFWSGFYDHPFPLIGRPDVYLTPEAAAALTPYPDLFQPANYTLPNAAVTALLDQDKVVVYTVEGQKLVNSTALYANTRKQEAGVSRLLLGDAVYEGFLGKEWYGREDGFRWMPRTATARLHGDGRTIRIAGFCVPEQFASREQITVRAEWNGADLGVQRITKGAKEYLLQFALPKTAAETGTLRLTVDAPITVAGDTRELGLAVSRIEMQ